MHFPAASPNIAISAPNPSSLVVTISPLRCVTGYVIVIALVSDLINQCQNLYSYAEVVKLVREATHVEVKVTR